MPTASLPIEPASSDEEMFESPRPVTPEASRKELSSSVQTYQRKSTLSDMAASLAIEMRNQGFGAELGVLSYQRPWFALSQMLRYEQADAMQVQLYERRYGLHFGLELHPWRSSMLSPLAMIRMGGDRFLRGWQKTELDLFAAEAALGVELALVPAATFVFQWSHRYYPGLNEQLFAEQSEDSRSIATFQVLFNLKWQTTL